MISFIIPAHNEERLLGVTLEAVRAAASTLGDPYEVIVVDDASTDCTAAVAGELGAVVVSVTHRQIAATRNAGAQRSNGEVLIFVDADTTVDDEVVRAAIQAVRNGAVGGSAVAHFERPVPLYAYILGGIWFRVAKFARLTSGCFLFCTREAYDAVGGFDETLYAFEDVAMGRALARLGKVVLLPKTVATSSRNLRAHSGTDAVRMLVGLVRHGRGFFKSRSGLNFWYRDRH